MVNLSLGVWLTTHSYLSGSLKFLKAGAAVAFLVFLQLRFSHTWLASLGLHRVERFGTELASRKFLSVCLVGLSLFVIRSAVIPVSSIPLPEFHDEYSYLLAADTFAHARLTNPPHPMWEHFETFHVIWHPTYMSMYPPGQGLILALGQILGNPWIGQLIAAALMCAAICWMLQGWIPPQWALLGGVFAVARLGLLSYFANGYWCACLPAVGGALILGALPRIERNPRGRDAVPMAIGLFVLANTRPYEGLLLSVGVAIALFAWMLGKSKPPVLVSLNKFVLPLALVLAPLAMWTGYYNFRVTGSPFRMGYEINREAYAMGRYFVWQSPWPQKSYSDARLREKYEQELKDAQEYKTLRGFVRSVGNKFVSFWREYLVWPLPFVLLALPCAARDRRLRVPWMIAAIFVAGLAVEVWFLPHYFAPATALLFLFLMQCIRHLCQVRWRGKRAGLALVRAVSVIYIGTVVFRIALAVTHVHPESVWQHGDKQRESIVQRLAVTPGQHVVLVSYSPDFPLDREWVYNLSDIDGSKIVWARDMGTEKDRELFAYYPDRHFWKVHAESSAEAPLLEPYRDSAISN